MVVLINNSQLFDNDNLHKILFKFKEADCILYSEDGDKFEIHKEIFCQTKFMQNILFSGRSNCCANKVGNIEIICPCSSEDLECVVHFLYNGKIPYDRKNDSSKIVEILSKVFGYSEELYFDYPMNRKKNPEKLQSLQQFTEEGESKKSFTEIQKCHNFKSDKTFERKDLLEYEEDTISEEITEMDLEDETCSSNQNVVNVEQYDIVKKAEIPMKEKSSHSKSNLNEENPSGSLYKSFKNKNSLINHLKSSERMKNYGARDLTNREKNKETDFSNKGKALENYLAMNQIKIFLCKVCNRSFTDNSRLKRHINDTHDRKNSFTCYVCEAGFYNRGRMEKHFASKHRGFNPHKCSKCESDFLDIEQLKIHNAKVHEDKKKCNKCDASYQFDENLVQHLISTHNEKKPFVCQECFDGYKTKASLKTHVENIHLKVKNAHCSICGASFYNKSMLRIHTRCVHK